MFGAWGDATADGNVLQLRALDWDTDGPFQDYPQVTIYHGDGGAGGQTFANVGWTGWLGSITGMSASALASPHSPAGSAGSAACEGRGGLGAVRLVYCTWECAQAAALRSGSSTAIRRQVMYHSLPPHGTPSTAALCSQL